MGMYTEICVNADLIESTPDSVINILKAICDGDYQSKHLEGKPDRWSVLFNNCSYYTPSTCVAKLTFDEISKQYSIIGKGDIKNYSREIELFFEFIAPWCEGDFIGYHRYEEDREPILVFSSCDMEI